MTISFTVNKQQVRLNVSPLKRLLDILREDLGLTGSKEGCGEGECGACAVILDGELVNACLIPALQLSGREVTTIEGLGTEVSPDPIQTALVEEGAVQCGFCFPGIVVASRALLNRNPTPTRAEIRDGLAGNLCRCTGYEKIVSAIERLIAEGRVAPASTSSNRPVPIAECGDWGELIDAKIEFATPGSLSESIAYLAQHPDTGALLAGTTDFLTSLKLGHPIPGRIIDISRLSELRKIDCHEDTIEIGAAVSFATIASHEAIGAGFPSLIECALQVGSPAIRNRATLGGNLVSASPAADSPPVLMALGASVILASTAGRREVSVADFYTGYRQTVRRPDEILTSIRIPLPRSGTRQRFYKVGTRRAQAISKVCLAASARIDEQGRIQGARLAAGSVAPVTVALRKTQALLNGAVAGDIVEIVSEMASREVSPIDDVRSTAEYRRYVTGELARRFVVEELLRK